MLRFAAGFALVAAAGLYSVSAEAQTTSTGAFGNRTVGSSSGLSSPRNSSGTGGQTGQNPSTNGMTLMQSVDGGVSGTERYIRGNRQNQFVGVGSEDVRAVGVADMSASGAGQQFGSLLGGRNSGNLLGQLMQGSQFNQPGRTQSGRGSTPQLRVPISLGFTPRPIATSRITVQLQTRLGRLPALTTVEPLEVALEGEAVVLRGTVASEGDRQLAEELLMMAPEVTKVKNELKVQGLADTGASAPPVPTPANP
jgi:hypothetical protein